MSRSAEILVVVAVYLHQPCSAVALLFPAGPFVVVFAALPATAVILCSLAIAALATILWFIDRIGTVTRDRGRRDWLSNRRD
ncbi:MAG: hypothetical protein AAAB20_22460 [Rhizobium sp.]|uniref:hypothetical protein n=1 Tax=Rhizobium sp. TaxID=391 RepID=UPI000A515EE0